MDAIDWEVVSPYIFCAFKYDFINYGDNGCKWYKDTFYFQSFLFQNKIYLHKPWLEKTKLKGKQSYVFSLIANNNLSLKIPDN